ncbi:hypothetical protein CJI17_12745 [Aeromonas salmonicida]|nr:hypothetical protein CJI17_12745 [Aeromonas salmonicida]
MRIHRQGKRQRNQAGRCLEKPLKIRLDSRRRLRRIPLPQQHTVASLFNNLNQAICVGTHSIEHQTILLIFNVW